MLLAVLTLAAASAIAEATPELPNWTPTYKMSESTTIMPCNYSGFTNPDIIKGFGLVDFDWSNGKLDWSNAKPMDCQERLITQAEKVKSTTPYVKWFISRTHQNPPSCGNIARLLLIGSSVCKLLAHRRYSMYSSIVYAVRHYMFLQLKTFNIDDVIAGTPK